jgi:glycosyltransferase involved in cell wall biosynthesis
MKILRIIPSMDPVKGGPCQGIRNSIPELQKIESTSNEVVCLDSPNSSYLGKDTFEIHALEKGTSILSYSKKLYPWLIENYNRFDVIIVHGLWSYHSHAAIKAMINYRKKHSTSPKIYVMPHGMLDPYFQKAKERRFKAIRNEIYWKFIENRVINEADGLLFTCEEELLLAKTTFNNYKPKKEINVSYGIEEPPVYSKDMRNLFAETVNTWNGKPFLLFLSRIHPKKGLDLLIKAYLSLEKENVDLPQLIVAGPLKNSYATQMKILAEQSSNILFSGMLSGNAKWGAFYESEAFILPSHQENFGIAVAEAMACAKPVLISNKVNIWREIELGGGGLVSEDNLEGTTILLSNWVNLSSFEKSKISQKARNTFQNNFKISTAAAKLYNILKTDIIN